MLVQFILAAIFVSAVAYALGNLNGAIMISRRKYGGDVREHGSGNAGLTNFYRSFGKACLAQVIAIDVLKGFFAVLIGGLVFDWFGYRAQGMEWAYLCVVLGHIFPVAYDFRGGKGILTSVGAMLLIDWKLTLGLGVVFVVIVALTRFVSLGSVSAAVLLPFGTWFFVGQSVTVTAISVVVAILMIYMHRGNIGRLLRREERKLALSH